MVKQTQPDDENNKREVCKNTEKQIYKQINK